ncbi:MAG: heavy metal-binding domain-containing protein [Eubacterium sp.]|nr:heavy metal-binding domain-containing protein [Eubacterium sp.]MEE3398324.1 heavy metal-binding domain-containing protein [Eubacterium sp.]
MAENMMITTTSGFEGYGVTEYLGFVSSQAILGSNFISGIAANVADVARKDTAKLEQCREDAEQQLIKAAKRKGANAIIGMNMVYAPFEAGSFGIIVSGTAVKVTKHIIVSDELHKELFVTNYYNRLVPRPVKVVLDGDSNIINMKLVCYNYNHDDIKALRADVEFTNLYDERLVIKNVDFVFSENINQSVIESDYVMSKIKSSDLQLLKDAKIILTKYATPRGVYACNDQPINVSLSSRRLETLKAKRGIDAVEKYKSDGMIWTCNCGHVNEAGAEECVVCGRKQKDIMTKATFNYEEMIDRMKEKDHVVEIKDVLMQYIKEIDSGMRLELLEIMESGLQYEKTRGNMKETVIEKVEKVFEDASIED